MLATEEFQVSFSGLSRACLVMGPDQPGHLAVPTAGERNDAIGAAGERLRIERGLAARAGEVRFGEEAAQVGVATRRLREEREVGPHPHPLSLGERGDRRSG